MIVTLPIFCCLLPAQLSGGRSLGVGCGLRLWSGAVVDGLRSVGSWREMKIVAFLYVFI